MTAMESLGGISPSAALAVTVGVIAVVGIMFRSYKETKAVPPVNSDSILETVKQMTTGHLRSLLTKGQNSWDGYTA
jgi:hypothetical protein